MWGTPGARAGSRYKREGRRQTLQQLEGGGSVHVGGEDEELPGQVGEDRTTSQGRPGDGCGRSQSVRLQDSSSLCECLGAALLGSDLGEAMESRAFH